VREYLIVQTIAACNDEMAFSIAFCSVAYLSSRLWLPSNCLIVPFPAFLPRPVEDRRAVCWVISCWVRDAIGSVVVEWRKWESLLTQQRPLHVSSEEVPYET
jgi:hypothetical protein